MSTPADRARATAALNLAGRLDHLLRTARIYPDGHAGLVHTVRNVIDLAEAVRGEAASIDWSIVQDRVVVGNRVARPSPGLRDAVRELGEFLQSRGIGGLALLPGIDETQLMAAVRLIIGLEASTTEELDDTLDRIGEAKGVKGSESLIHLSTKIDRRG